MGSGVSGRFGGCFTAGTLVLTNYGLKPIEDIGIGEYVFSKNIETGQAGYQKVIETFQYTTNELISLELKNTILKVTLEHPFWVYKEGWKFAEDLKDDTVLIDTKEQPVTIEKIEKTITSENIFVYNFHVEDFCTYYVSELNILVHNHSKKKNDDYKKPKKGSGKDKATDIPSWAKGQKPRKGENGKDFAKRLCDEHFGEGNYPTKGQSDYYRILKNGDRGYE